MNMERAAPLHYTVVIILFLLSFCASDDRLIPGKPLSPFSTLVSGGGAFALGFFSPTNSTTSLYVSIWYNNIPRRTAVWVANRDRPITDASSASLAVTNQSSLVVSDANGGVLWTSANITGNTGRGTAVLLNNGNLVLQSPNGTTLWQSFDYPTDTILPGQKLRLSNRTHAAERSFSWKSPSDPSRGQFSAGADPNEYFQLLTLRGSSPYWRSEVWSGTLVSSTFQGKNSSGFYKTVVDTEGEIYITFGLVDGSTGTRYTLQPSGNLQMLIWNSDSVDWSVVVTFPAYDCDHYGYCGPYGYCDAKEAVPVCKCLEGFEPKSSNFSDGCRRKEALQCGGGGDGFLTLSNMKVPDKFVFVRNRSLEECAAECSSNCSCTAYAYANLSSGGVRSGDASRCLVWMGELVDTGKRADDSGENLYLRLAGLRGRKSNLVIKVAIPILASVLILLGICLAFSCRLQAKWKNKKKHNRLVLGDQLSTSNDLGEVQNIGFPFINFEDIIIATDNFSTTNMLGQGGFGKVYKGILGDGSEVAVKRLGKSSGQGAEEFRNEVVLIAKLQHRNLVKLLGCCIQGDEKLLVYEYLPNKSLDAFLFDAARKSVLDWPMRFNIIKGVARGLLYLHQDSRLRIVHRDLKASNILLDAEMSPKISDFGMARIFGGNEQQANTNRVVGTYGYMSPEYAMEGAFSVKSDVYSFGVLLLEIVSGLKISSPHLVMDFPNLIVYAWSLWKEGKASDLVDTSMERCTTDESVRCIHIGLLCVQDNPNARPLMSSVVFMLENGSTPLPSPKEPLYFFRRNQDYEEYKRMNSVNNLTLTVVEGR